MIAMRCTAWLLLLATGAALMSPPQMALAQGVSWRQALDRLAREKALAEGCASVLKIFADGAPMARVQGERLYARAKADADGLIALLLGDLADERSPADVPELRQRLEAMPRQRQALCRHVDLAIGAAAREQVRAVARLTCSAKAPATPVPWSRRRSRSGTPIVAPTRRSARPSTRRS